jgi:hypothetical protein
MRSATALSVCALLICACDGPNVVGPDGGDQPEFIQVTGALSRSGASSLGLGAHRRGGLGTLGLPGIDDSTTIDRVAAVPHFRGSVKEEHRSLITSVPLGADGSFALELATVFDWVLLLEDSTAGPEERVRAYVTIGDVHGSLTNLPVSAARSNLDLGTLRGSGDEAQGTTTMETASQSFSLSLSTLTQMAKVDDAYRNVINAYLNWDPATRVYYDVVPQVVWSDYLAKVVDGSTGPDRYTFLGYGLWIPTNDPRLDVAGICDGSKKLHIVPPADVRVGTGETFGPGKPFQMSGPPQGGGGGCSDQMFMSVGANGDGVSVISTPVSYHPEFPTPHFVDVVQGWWRLEQDGEVLAQFDLGLAAPVDGDMRPTGVVPVGRSTVDGSSMVTGLDLEWVRWDAASAAYVAVEVETLAQLLGMTALTFWGRTGPGGTEAKEEIVGPYEAPIITSVTPTKYSWFSGGYPDLPAGAAILTDIRAQWTTGGIDHQVWWHRPPCIDIDADGRSYCQGDNDDKPPEQSYCSFRNAAGAKFTENGKQYVPLAASYYGSFEFMAACALAPDARPFVRAAYELAASDGTILDAFEAKPYEHVIKEYANAGTGDYTLTVTPYDALDNAYEAVVVSLRVLPFTDFHRAPAMTAKLGGSGGGTELLVTFNYLTAYPSPDCLTFLSGATAALLEAGGCDTGLASDANCGGCGLACGGQETCQAAGFCYHGGGACAMPMKDCDGNAGTGTNGCETDVTTDRLHCGACGRACAAGFDCVSGACRPRCGPAVGDCDDNPGTGTGGCETDLLASTANCGACGHACTGGAACTDGICVNASDTCAPGLADCDGSAATGVDGCEASLHDDDANCGSCGHACGVEERCRGGACRPRCPKLVGDCLSPRDGPWLAVTCAFASGDAESITYRYTWSGSEAPVAVGDRIALRADWVPWGCEDNFIHHVPGVPLSSIPCPGFFPPLTARVAAQ